MHYSANLLGGVKFDISPQQADAIHKGVDFPEERNHLAARFVVRINELFESHRLNRKTLDKLPQRDRATY